MKLPRPIVEVAQVALKMMEETQFVKPEEEVEPKMSSRQRSKEEIPDKFVKPEEDIENEGANGRSNNLADQLRTLEPRPSSISLTAAPPRPRRVQELGCFRFHCKLYVQS